MHKTPSQTHAEQRCAPLDRPPASYRDGTRTPQARRWARDIRQLRAFKVSHHA